MATSGLQPIIVQRLVFDQLSLFRLHLSPNLFQWNNLEVANLRPQDYCSLSSGQVTTRSSPVIVSDPPSFFDIFLAGGLRHGNILPRTGW